MHAGSGRTLNVWRDDAELTAGPLSASIQEALRCSHYLIVLCSPRAKQSRYVNQEIEWFLQTANEADDRVLTLLVDGNPEGAVPKTITKIDNLRVDVRADNLELQLRRLRETEIFRLLATLLGVPFDTLFRREERRRSRRSRLRWTAAVAIGLALSGATLVTALQASAAAAERDRAEQALSVALDSLLLPLAVLRRLESSSARFSLPPATSGVAASSAATPWRSSRSSPSGSLRTACLNRCGKKQPRARSAPTESGRLQARPKGDPPSGIPVFQSNQCGSNGRCSTRQVPVGAVFSRMAAASADGPDNPAIQWFDARLGFASGCFPGR